jgi:hypothetical protein
VTKGSCLSSCKGTVGVRPLTHCGPPTYIEWQRCLGGGNDDAAYGVVQAADGGYVVAGYTDSYDGNVSGKHDLYDYWVTKLDASGKMKWQRCLGGDNYDWAHSIQQTSDGGYVVAGETQSNDGNVSGNHGGADYWVTKLNGSGNLVWQKCLGGDGNDLAHSIRQTSDGGYVVAGSTESNGGDVSGNHGLHDYWVVKLDSSGSIVWRKCLGGNNSDWASSIQQTSDDGYVVAGATLSNDGDVSGNHGSNDYWAVKLDSSGNLVWRKCLGGNNSDWASSIQQTSDGGYVVAGATLSNDGDVSEDFWVVKLDSSGKKEWRRPWAEARMTGHLASSRHPMAGTWSPVTAAQTTAMLPETTAILTTG